MNYNKLRLFRHTIRKLAIFSRSYNFYLFLSSIFVHVEREFGVFVDIFGIPWIPVQINFTRSTKVVCDCAVLQKFIIYNDYRAFYGDEDVFDFRNF